MITRNIERGNYFMQYCLKCGRGNPIDAVFCNKCGKSFKEEVKASTPVSRPKPKIYIEPEEEEVIPKRLRPHRKSSIPTQPPISEVAQAAMHTTEVGEEEDEEEEGESLDFVPEVTGLEIESIQTDVVRGVSFGQLVAEAEAQKRQQEQK